MPQKQTEKSFSLEKYSETVEKRNGLRTKYKFPVETGKASDAVAAIRKYANNSGYVYTDEEREEMPDESIQVYIYNNSSIVITSRAYTERTKERALREIEEIAEYAYALLRDSKLLRV
jgi:hypothetical protein